MTPHGRGFDTSFGYLTGGEDHFTHHIGGSEMGCAGTDLYRTNGPAYTGNGTYGAYLYNDEVVSIVRSHNLSVPLFLYVATQDAHGDRTPSLAPAGQSAPAVPPYRHPHHHPGAVAIPA